MREDVFKIIKYLIAYALAAPIMLNVFKVYPGNTCIILIFMICSLSLALGMITALFEIFKKE